MDRDIHLAGEQRSFDFGREQSFSTSLEVNNFGVIAAGDYDFGLDGNVRMRVSNCLLNQQSLGASEIAPACAEVDRRNHRGNVTLDTMQWKASTSPTTPRHGADFR
jgi:hypothetical protein